MPLRRSKNSIFRKYLRIFYMFQKVAIITLLRGGDVVNKFLFEVSDLLGGDGIEVTTDTSVDDTNLDGDIHRLVLVLLEELSKTLTWKFMYKITSSLRNRVYHRFLGKFTSGKELLGGGVHVGTELGEGGDLTVLGQIELHGSRNLFHSLHLGGGSDTGDGKTDVNGGTDTLKGNIF